MKLLSLSKELQLPLDAITRTFGIFGQRGSGKSTTAARFVEEAVRAGGRAVVLDPTGVWHGLTREGTKLGLPGVVLGGEHADAPLEPAGGDLVGEFVIGTDYPLVVLDLKLFRKGQRQKFAMEFLERLYHDNRDPILVVIDEAPQFAPAMMRGRGEDAVVPRLLGAVEDVVSLGRSRGLGIVLISQRFATVNANVREQVETIIVHRLIGKLDRTALGGWIEANGDPEREKEMMAIIAKLHTGRALVWSPAFLEFFGDVQMLNATTFDSRATPKVGAAKQKLTERAPINLAELETRMAATIEEHRSKDPSELQKQLRVARHDLSVAQSDLEGLRSWSDELGAAGGENAVEEVVNVYMLAKRHVGFSCDLVDEVRALAERPVETVDLSAVAEAVQVVRDAEAATGAAYDRLREVLDPVAQNILHLQVETPRPAREPERRISPEPLPRATPAAPRPPRDPVKGGESNVRVSNPQQKLLDTLAWFEAIGVSEPRKAPLAMMAGFSSKSSGYRANLSALSSSGLIERSGERIRLSEAGRVLSDPPDTPLTNEALQNAIYKAISGPQGTLLSVLIQAYPNPVGRDDLAERAGVSPISSGFRANISTLSSLELVYYPEAGTVAASDLLFPLGRPS